MNASFMVLLVVDGFAVINPFGGALEGCFRAYTEKDGPMAQWPGLILSTGTEVCLPHVMFPTSVIS